MKKEKVYLKVLDYTEDPGPRYKRQDKDNTNTSGEMYYISILNSVFAECYEQDKELVILLDGVSGYPSSFLDEAIGELVYDFSLEVVRSILSFDTVMFRRRAKQVIEETYPQWEEKRVRNINVVHSANISKTLKKLDANGNIVEYTIG